jgi:23S rRNA (uracil1939-C5)-methyltransferase
LAIKKMQIVETFRRIGSFPDPPVADVIPSPRPFNYRGKADFWLRRQGGRRGAAGFLRSRSRDIIDVERCEIIAESLNQALKGLREQLRKCPVNVDGQQVTAWAWGREIGANVTAAALNDTVLAKALLGQPLPSNLFSLPAGSGQVAAKKSFLRRDLTVEPCHDPNGCGCSAIIPDIRSVHANAEGNLAYCGDVVPRIVKGRTFLVPAQGFFQANLYLVEQLVDTVVAMCALTGRETVLDAYCGSGLFSMFLASAARRILGVELWMKAINCARDNLAKAGYDNADFIAGDVGDVMESRLIASGQSFDVLLLDPPRTGCQGKVISSIKEMKPKRIVYVSCNPATLARDCRFLAEHGYILQSLQPFDMFPQTGHTEVVALLLLPD